MIFDDSLREFITNKVKFFRDNPDRLIISVEKGSIKWSGQGLSHVQEYSLLVELDEYPEKLDANEVFVVILDWYQQNQDPLPPNSKSPIQFESYVLSNYTTTVVISIDVKETVRVQYGDHNDYIFDSCTLPSVTPDLIKPYE